MKKGFTLIEILIVVAIIGVLATIVIVNLDSAQAKSRDARIVSDLSMITKAFELYQEKNGTYLIDVTQYGGNNTTVYKGCGWFNATHADEIAGGSIYNTKSVNQGLIDAGYLSGTIMDPSGAVICRADPAYTQKYCYSVYLNASKLSAFAKLESPSPAQSATIGNALSLATGDIAQLGANYAVNIIP